MRRLIWKFLPGYVTITLEGVYLDAFLNEIRKSYRIRTVKRQQYTRLSMTICARDREEILRAAERYGVRCIGVWEDARLRLSAGVFRKWWLTLTAALLLAGAVILSGFCLRIEFYGNDTLSEFTLVALLEQNGFCAGMRKRAIELNTLEKLLYRTYPTLAYVEAHFSGTTLVVTLEEGNPKPELASREPCSVAAKKRGVLLRLSVGEGLANVRVGDLVEAGDILICGDYRKNEHDFLVHARGTAIAQVEYIAAAEMSPEEGLVRTGNVAVRRCMELGSLQIPLHGENPFALYEEERRVVAEVPRNMPAFLRITETTYYECVRGISEETRLAAEIRLREQAYFQALSQLPENAEPIDFYSVLTERAGMLRATATITVKEDIGVQIPIETTEGDT